MIIAFKHQVLNRTHSCRGEHHSERWDYLGLRSSRCFGFEMVKEHETTKGGLFSPPLIKSVEKYQRGIRLQKSLC